MASNEELVSLEDVHIDELLQHVMDSKGSELRIAPGFPPCVRVHGRLKAITAYENFSAQIMWRLINDLLTNEQMRQLESEGQLTFFYTTADATAYYNVLVFRVISGTCAQFHLLLPLNPV